MTSADLAEASLLVCAPPGLVVLSHPQIDVVQAKRGKGDVEGELRGFSPIATSAAVGLAEQVAELGPGRSGYAMSIRQVKPIARQVERS